VHVKPQREQQGARHAHTACSCAAQVRTCRSSRAKQARAIGALDCSHDCSSPGKSCAPGAATQHAAAWQATKHNVQVRQTCCQRARRHREAPRCSSCSSAACARLRAAAALHAAAPPQNTTRRARSAAAAARRRASSQAVDGASPPLRSSQQCCRLPWRDACAHATPAQRRRYLCRPGERGGSAACGVRRLHGARTSSGMLVSSSAAAALFSACVQHAGVPLHAPSVQRVRAARRRASVGSCCDDDDAVAVDAQRCSVPAPIRAVRAAGSRAWACVSACARQPDKESVRAACSRPSVTGERLNGQMVPSKGCSARSKSPGACKQPAAARRRSEHAGKCRTPCGECACKLVPSARDALT
jgi:hypothetical protein